MNLPILPSSLQSATNETRFDQGEWFAQDFIDRRYFRKKYNAEQALAQFAETARDEVDMEKLTAALIGVVEETMQPERVSVWLKPTEKRTGAIRDDR